MRTKVLFIKSVCTWCRTATICGLWLLMGLWRSGQSNTVGSRINPTVGGPKMGHGGDLQRLLTIYHQQARSLWVFSSWTSLKHLNGLDRSPAPHPSALAGHQAVLWATETGQPQKLQGSVSGWVYVCACKQFQQIRIKVGFCSLITLLKSETIIKIKNWWHCCFI